MARFIKYLLNYEIKKAPAPHDAGAFFDFSYLVLYTPASDTPLLLAQRPAPPLVSFS